jgi:hypothetical protein
MRTTNTILCRVAASVVSLLVAMAAAAAPLHNAVLPPDGAGQAALDGGQPGAVAIARPALTPPPTGTNQFLLTFDVAGGYRNMLGTQDYGIGEVNLQLGLERRRWTLGARAAAAYGTGIGRGIGGSYYYGMLLELMVGPAFAVKLGKRVRLGLTAGLGIGWATYNENYWHAQFEAPPADRALLVAANADLSVDLYRAGPHTLYAVFSPGMVVWTERQNVAGTNLQGQNEVTLRLGLGYRLKH